MANCKSCEAPITWCKSESGKNMPMDEKPDPLGKFIILNGVARTATEKDDKLLRPRYTCHYATCPDAAQWRKR